MVSLCRSVPPEFLRSFFLQATPLSALLLLSNHSNYWKLDDNSGDGNDDNDDGNADSGDGNADSGDGNDDGDDGRPGRLLRGRPDLC